MFRRLLVLAAAAFILTTAINAQIDSSGAVLKGGWLVTLAPEGGPPPFPVLFAFTADGGVIETDQGAAAPGQPLSIFSAGVGGWERVAGRQFNITYTQLQYDQAHNIIGSFRGRITAELNRLGNELTGDITVEFYDVNGVLVFSGNGTVHGVKLSVVGAN